MSKNRYFTVEDIVNRLMESGADRQSIDYFSGFIDRECFICEERFGGADRITYELRELRGFLLERLVPRIEAGLADEPAVELEQFMQKTLSEETLRHQLISAGRRELRASLTRGVQLHDAIA